MPHPKTYGLSEGSLALTAQGPAPARDFNALQKDPYSSISDECWQRNYLLEMSLACMQLDWLDSITTQLCAVPAVLPLLQVSIHLVNDIDTIKLEIRGSL